MGSAYAISLGALLIGGLRRIGMGGVCNITSSLGIGIVAGVV